MAKVRQPDIRPELVIEDPVWGELIADVDRKVATICTSLTRALTDLWAEEPFVQMASLGFGLNLVDDPAIQILNRDYRGKDKPTNVLSFATLDDPDHPIVPNEELWLGDVILARQICQTEAKDANKSLEDHFTHLLVHGFLHLLGYDHEVPEDATIMENLEIDILKQLGIPNPYV